MKWIRRVAAAWVLTLLASVAVGQEGESVDEADDEAFWSADTLLAARVDSLGRAAVVGEIEATLQTAAARLDDPAAAVTYVESEMWIDAMRWAAILGEESSLPLLDAVAGVPVREQNAVIQPRLAYFARTAAYRIRTGELSPAAQAAALAPQLIAPEAGTRDFAAEQLLRLGSPALPPLLEYVKGVLLPRVAAMPAEPFSEEDLRPQLEYLYVSDLVRNMLKTDQDRALLEAWMRDDDPQTSGFAQEVLGLER